jgi:hypothetical protein
MTELGSKNPTELGRTVRDVYHLAMIGFVFAFFKRNSILLWASME